MAVWNVIGNLLSTAGQTGYKNVRSSVARLRSLRRAGRYRYEEPAPSEIFSQRARYDRIKKGEEPAEVFSSFRMRRAARPPMFSILMSVCEPDRKKLEESVISVLGQTYGNLELIVADSSLTNVARDTLAEYQDDRIRYCRLRQPEGPSAELNAAARKAAGDYVAVLEYGDLLTADALYEIACAVMETGAEIIYTDEDHCDMAGKRFFEPVFKPDFNKDYLFANNYTRHLLTIRRELFLAMRLRSRFDGAHDYDMILRAPKSGIYHVPRVLYHARGIRQPALRLRTGEACRAALEDYFRERGIRARVTPGRKEGFLKVEYLPDIFTARKEVGVVGGKVLDRRHRVIGGMMDEDGNVFFEGLDELEEGPGCAAMTMQDAHAVDVRCMKIRRELYSVYKEIFGYPYESHILNRQTGLKEKSIDFCDRVRSLGYLIVWDPEMVSMIRDGIIRT